MKTRPQRNPPDPMEDRVFRTHPAFSEDRKAQKIDRARRPLRRRYLVLQGFLFLLVAAMWPLPIVNPIKLMVVLFHELSHVVAAYATGGVAFGIAIDPGGAGVTIGFGGVEWVIVAAGYFGSFVIGALLFYLTATWEPKEVWGVICILCCLTLTFDWLNEFTAVFGYGALFLMVVGIFASDDVFLKPLLRLTAATCCLYPVIDVMGELLSDTADGFLVRGETVGSDVTHLASLTGVSEVLYAVLWVVLGTVTVVWLTWWSATREATRDARRSLFPRKPPQPRHPVFGPYGTSTIPEYRIR